MSLRWIKLFTAFAANAIYYITPCCLGKFLCSGALEISFSYCKYFISLMRNPSGLQWSLYQSIFKGTAIYNQGGESIIYWPACQDIWHCYAVFGCQAIDAGGSVYMWRLWVRNLPGKWKQGFSNYGQTYLFTSPAQYVLIMIYLKAFQMFLCFSFTWAILWPIWLLRSSRKWKGKLGILQ